MDAVLVLANKDAREGGYIQEIVVWRIPVSVPGSNHSFKYRLFLLV